MRNLCCLGKTLAVAMLCCGIAVAADGQNSGLTTSGATPTSLSIGGPGAQDRLLTVPDPSLFPLQPHAPVVPIMLLVMALVVLWRGAGAWSLG